MLVRTDCRIRPILVEDLDLVLTWRNSDHVRPHMYTDHLITSDEHRNWFRRLQESDSDIFLIFEIQKIPLGIVQFNRIDKINGISTWGFYLGELNIPPGTGTVMGVLGIEHAFLNLDLRKVYGEVLAFNKASIRYHQKLGFIEEGRFREHIFKNNKYNDLVVFGLLRSEWSNYRKKLEEIAF